MNRWLLLPAVTFAATAIIVGGITLVVVDGVVRAVESVRR